MEVAEPCAGKQEIVDAGRGKLWSLVLGRQKRITCWGGEGTTSGGSDRGGGLKLGS